MKRALIIVFTNLVRWRWEAWAEGPREIVLKSQRQTARLRNGACIVDYMEEGVLVCLANIFEQGINDGLRSESRVGEDRGCTL